MNTVGTSLLVLGLLLITGPGGSAVARKGGPFTPHNDLVDSQKEGDKGGKDKRKPKFTVGKETTYVTGPRDKDGYIDYEAALNERLRQGVKPENNANVLLWQAFGPHPEGATMPPEFFKLMGVEAPPQKGEYFTDLFRFMKEHLKVDPHKQADELFDQMDRASARPWTAKDYPHIAAWLKANEKPLALVLEASKRSHYYSPLTSRRAKDGSPGGLIAVLLPGVQKCREFASALSARAMLHIGEGRYDEAWQDLLACHRLARLMGRSSTLIEGLVGVAIDAIASGGDLVFLDRAKLDAKRIKACLSDLQALPPLPPAADRVDLGERFMFLDSVMLLDRHGLRYLEGLAGGKVDKGPDPKLKDFQQNIDWDPALRNANRWYDRLAAAMRLKGRGAREKQLDQFEEELKTLKAKLANSEDLAKVLLGAKQPPEAMGRVIGDVLITLLIPAVRKVQQADDRAEQIQRNVHLAFALAAYQRDQGRYPPKLDALAPKYLAQIPQDLFSGKALIYRPSEKGYLLYSVGPNGKDEQGRWYDDDPPGDDPGVRMPLPEPRKK
jgi:hypothetical protein